MTGTYRGSGWYSGWVLDCDGTAIKQDTWGWATPTTQWCGLPLSSAADLDSFLDRYLQSPPECYVPPFLPEETTVLPSISKVSGLAGTDWRSELALVNTSDERRIVDLQLRTRNLLSKVVAITLDPGESRIFPDAMNELFQKTGSASLWITSLPGILAGARVYNQTDSGQFGQYIRAIPLNYAIAYPMTGHLYPLEENSSFRTNLGLVNATEDTGRFTLRVYTPEGDILHSETIELQPRQYLLKSRFLLPIAGEGVEGLRAEIEPIDEGSSAFVFASIVDNVSGDPIYFEALPHLYSFDVEVAGVAHTEGSNGTHWRSRIALTNTNRRPVQIEAHFRPNNGALLGPISINLEPHALELIEDPLGSLFDAEGAGTLIFSADHGFAAAGRTFNDSGERGSYGQRSPGIDPSGERTLYPGLLGHLIQLDENSSRRTNLGLMNFGSEVVDIEAVFFGSSGSEIGRQSYHLGAGRSRQINRVFRKVTDESISGGRIELRVLNAGGRATAWASTVDARTGDPVFQTLRVQDRR